MKVITTPTNALLSLIALSLFNSVDSASLTPLPTELRVILAPDKVHETCFSLQQNDTIEFAFNSSDPMLFNLHYHEKEQVLYPIAEQLTPKFRTTKFTARLNHTYCLMWRNPQSNAVELDFSISQPIKF